MKSSTAAIDILACLLLCMIGSGCAGDRSISVTEGSPLPISTAGHAGGLVAGMPVVVGGSHWSPDKTTKRWLHECFIYRRGHWEAGPDFRRPTSDAAFATDGRALFVAGGTDGNAASNAAAKLAASGGKLEWQELPPLPIELESAGGAFLDGTFYVVGGFTKAALSNELFALDTTAKESRWRTLAPLPAPGRGYMAIVAAGSSLYVFGGYAAPPHVKEFKVFDDAYRYDPANDRWEQLADVRMPGYAWTAVAIDDHTLLFAGRVAKVGEVTSELFELDLRTFRTRTRGNTVTPTTCVPGIQVKPMTWWFPGGEPSTDRSRTDRTSIVAIRQ